MSNPGDNKLWAWLGKLPFPVAVIVGAVIVGASAVLAWFYAQAKSWGLL